MAYQEEQKRGSDENVKYSSASSNPLLKTPPTADVDWVWLNNSTRQDPITGHYFDDHTRPTLTPEQCRTIFQEAQELNVPEPTAEQIADFEKDGVITLHDIIPLHIVEALNNRVDAVFSGKHDTNSYPDEWYWRSEISPNDITRHAVGTWKADRGIASLVFNASLARFAAKLSGLNGVRIGGVSAAPVLGLPVVYCSLTNDAVLCVDCSVDTGHTLGQASRRQANFRQLPPRQPLHTTSGAAAGDNVGCTQRHWH